MEHPHQLNPELTEAAMFPRKLCSFLFISTLLYVGAISAQDPPPYQRTENIVFSVADGVGLLLDVFEPISSKNGLGIVLVLSGGWKSGEAPVEAYQKAGVFDILTEHGMTVFMVRTGSRGRFSGEEMVANLKTGIRWVKCHAAEYRVDPDRLGIVGASAGGHLGLMALISPEPANPEAEEPLERFGTDLKAAGIFFPPTDIVDWNGQPDGYKLLGDVLFRCGLEGIPEEEARAKAEAISPARLVKTAPPPILLIHGDADPLVPLQQSHKMVEAVQKVGGQVELVVKEGGGHPWPDLEVEVRILSDWFEKTLGANAPAKGK